MLHNFVRSEILSRAPVDGMPFRPDVPSDRLVTLLIGLAVPGCRGCFQSDEDAGGEEEGRRREEEGKAQAGF